MSNSSWGFDVRWSRPGLVVAKALDEFDISLVYLTLSMDLKYFEKQRGLYVAK